MFDWAAATTFGSLGPIRGRKLYSALNLLERSDAVRTFSLNRPVATDSLRSQLVSALVRCGDGDRDAFTELYKLTHRKLHFVCSEICWNRSDADDVLAEVYIIIWKSAHRWRSESGTPIAWLSTIARNRAIDWYRRQGKFMGDPSDDAAHVADSSPLSDARLIDAEQLVRLRLVLQSLRPHQRRRSNQPFSTR